MSINISKLTMKECIQYSYVSAPLFRAVVRQAWGWNNLKEEFNDIAKHGASGGYCGFTWHCETVPFAHKNRQTIVDLAVCHAREFGQDTIEMLYNFNAIRPHDITKEEVLAWILNRPLEDDADTQISNTLAWYALETVCQDIQSYVDSEED